MIAVFGKPTRAVGFIDSGKVIWTLFYGGDIDEEIAIATAVTMAAMQDASQASVPDGFRLERALLPRELPGEIRDRLENDEIVD